MRGGILVHRRSDLLRRATIHLGAIGLACLTAAVLLVPGALGSAKSAESIACGGQRNAVDREFDIARPSEIWQHFPAMLKAPELEADTNLAHVVVFRGDFSLDGLMAGSENGNTVSDVICIVQSDGTVNVYDNVSRAGESVP